MPSILASTIVKSFDRARFDQSLQDLETELEHFKLRYQNFLADWQQYQDLQAQLQDSENPENVSDPPHIPDPAELEQSQRDLLQEYDRLREQLAGIETRWEAQFFSWEGFGTVFWQVVRFLGLGLVLGWWLRGCAG